MAINIKEIAQKEDLLAPGHRACRGCGEPIIVRQVLLAAENPVVLASPTGCLEIISSPYPYTSLARSFTTMELTVAPSALITDRSRS